MIRTHEVYAGALALLMCAMVGSATAAETITVSAKEGASGLLKDEISKGARRTYLPPPIWSILRPCMIKTKAVQ